MKIEDLRIYESKKITLFLKNKFYYTGHILEFLDDTLKFKDKFGNIILIDGNEIATITESNEDRR